MAMMNGGGDRNGGGFVLGSSSAISPDEKSRLEAMQHDQIQYAKISINLQIKTRMQILRDLCRIFGISTEAAQHILSCAFPLTDPGVLIIEDGPERLVGLERAHSLYEAYKDDITGNLQNIYNELRDYPLSIADTNLVWKLTISRQSAPLADKDKLAADFTALNEIAFIKHEKAMMVQEAIRLLAGHEHPDEVTRIIQEKIKSKPGGCVQFADDIIAQANIVLAKRKLFGDLVDSTALEAMRMIRDKQSPEDVKEYIASKIGSRYSESTYIVAENMAFPHGRF